MPERTEQSLALEDAARKIDGTQSWQFLGGNCSTTEEKLMLKAVSRGPISPISNDEFGDLSEFVDVDAEPADEYLRLHVITYAGDIAGLEMFTMQLCDNFDGRTEGDVNVIEEYVRSNPFWMLDAL